MKPYVVVGHRFSTEFYEHSTTVLSVHEKFADAEDAASDYEAKANEYRNPHTKVWDFNWNFNYFEVVQPRF